MTALTRDQIRAALRYYAGSGSPKNKNARTAKTGGRRKNLALRFYPSPSRRCEGCGFPFLPPHCSHMLWAQCLEWQRALRATSPACPVLRQAVR
jgi:hypothetical protein